ncbi:MAG: DUF294 nucleotidyltransferase-like domain-containing protein [Pseudomonadota bacterium]
MNEIPEITRFISTLPGFDALDDAIISNAASAISISYFKSGNKILAIGDHNKALFVVRSGAVELRDEQGELDTRLGESEYFGFPSIMGQRPVRRDAIAIEDCLVYVIPEATFAALRSAYPNFDTYFIRAMTERLLKRERPPEYRGSLAQSVNALITRPPVTIPHSATIRETASAMVEQRVSAMLVLDDTQRCVGIVTDRDIRSRVVAVGADPAANIRTIMSADPITLDADALAFEAALTMMQHAIHHVPVTREGELVGMVSRSDFMRLETEHPLYLISDLGKQSTAKGLADVCTRLPALIAGQIDSGATGEQLGKFITTVTDTATRQLLRIAAQELGEPPCDFAWVALGSQGRAEQSAKSDQDNALILADDCSEQDMAYFAAAAKIVNDGLDACGYVYCPGDVMASNPEWRQPLSRWKAYFHNWITVPEQKALMHANIFFDLRAVAGNQSLVDNLKDSIRQSAKDNEIFLALMARNAMTFHPPLGLFRQFVVERSGEHRDTLDLKLRGIMPIVEIARIRSLAAGQIRVGTRNRLAAAAEAGELSTVDAANLRDALDFIEQLRLEHQSAQMAAGKAPDNHLSPKTLSALNRQNLKAAFSQVRVSQAALLNRFHIV